MFVVTLFASLAGMILEVLDFWRKDAMFSAILVIVIPPLVVFIRALLLIIPPIQRLFTWISSKSNRDVLLEAFGEAKLFEEWEAAAFQLDEELNYDLWRQNPTSKYYDYRLISERLQAIIAAHQDDDILGLVSLLRSGLVRNLGNITAPQLFSRAFAGTKTLIEDYVTRVALAIEYVTSYPTSPDFSTGLTNQQKLDVLHDTRQAFGRTALVLQGGSIFGLCHIGVVKALHLRGLLPRIIAGTATGALIAALVGVHTEDELLGFLTADGIDLTAFMKRGKKAESDDKSSGFNFEDEGWYSTSIRRLKRLFKEGHLLDMTVLEECVRANVGDLTFEEAYHRTKRVLNITVSPSSGSVPTLLNYLTAPNVLIWSAALASNSSSTLYTPTRLMCKDPDGAIIAWPNAIDTTFRPAHHHTTSGTAPSSGDHRDSPLARMGELFNVNHFIVSQARPYLAPFLRSDFHRADPRREHRWRASLPLARLVVLEIQHRLAQLDALGLLPAGVRRFLLDENIPAASLLVVPELSPRDFVRLLENPTRRSVDYWIGRGERSVWPAVCALRVRCAIEVEVDRGYQMVRRRKPFDVGGGTTPRTGKGRREKGVSWGSDGRGDGEE